MSDSTSLPERSDLPEQNGDPSVDNTLERTLLRRYTDAGVLKSEVSSGLARRYQRLSAQGLTLARAIQRRWLPGANSAGGNQSALVFRQRSFNAHSALPVVQGRPQTALQRTGEEGGEPGTPTSPEVNAVSIARQLQQAPALFAPTKDIGAAAVRRQAVAGARPLPTRQPEHAADRSLTVQTAPSLASQVAPTKDIGAAPVARQAIAPARLLPTDKLAATAVSSAAADMAVVAANRSPLPVTSDVESSASRSLATQTTPSQAPQAAPITDISAATVRRRAVAGARPLPPRQPEGVATKSAATDMAVVAANRPPLSVASDAERSADRSLHVQTALTADADVAPMFRQTVAPARPLLDPQLGPEVARSVATDLAMATPRRLPPITVAGSTEAANQPRHRLGRQTAVVQAAPSGEHGIRSVQPMADALSHPIVRRLDSRSPGAPSTPVAIAGAQRLMTVSRGVDLSQGPFLGTAKQPVSKVLVQAVRQSSVQSTPGTAPANSSRLTPNKGSPANRSEAMPLLAMAAALQAEPGAVNDVARTTELMAPSRMPYLVAARQAELQPTIEMPVLRAAAAPELSRELDFGQPSLPRWQGTTESELPVVTKSALIAGTSPQAFTQRAPPTTDLRVFAAAESTAESSSAATSTPASSANGAGRGSALDGVNIEQLAERVIDIIERRITIEAESRGLPTY